ncbi:hypothetical protein QYF36_021883 [Acer negundo]|nr:hypothetical protein QYF36_021883 [Acer negundo]
MHKLNKEPHQQSSFKGKGVMTRKVCGKSVISNAGVIIGKKRIGYNGDVSRSSSDEDCVEEYVGNFIEFRGETSRVGLNHSMDGNLMVDLGFIENVTCGHLELGHIGSRPLYVINNKAGPSVSSRDGLGIGHMVGNQDVNSSQAKETAYDGGLGVNNMTESEGTNKEPGSQRNSGRGQDLDKEVVNERRYQSSDKTSHRNKKKKDKKNVDAFKKHGITTIKDKRSCSRVPGEAQADGNVIEEGMASRYGSWDFVEEIVRLIEIGMEVGFNFKRGKARAVVEIDKREKEEAEKYTAVNGRR